VNVSYVNGRLRTVAAALWLALLAWVAATWLGVIGVTLVCIAATRWYRALCSGQQRPFSVEAAQLRRVWAAPWAVCVDAGQGPQWLCRDEVPPAQWAQTLRWLYQHVPAQAVGFSMSR
jgi:hypothetical protein